MILSSKLQTKIALTTAEVEYIALSQFAMEIICLVNLIKGLNSALNFGMKDSVLRYNLYEENTSCITMAESHKFTPRTKQISLKYHWFEPLVKGSEHYLMSKTLTPKTNGWYLHKAKLGKAIFVHLRR